MLVQLWAPSHLTARTLGARDDNLTRHFVYIPQNFKHDSIFTARPARETLSKSNVKTHTFPCQIKQIQPGMSKGRRAAATAKTFTNPYESLVDRIQGAHVSPLFC